MRPFILACALIGSACGSKVTTPIAPPPPEACVRDRTAIVTFENQSPNRLSFDVYLDGSRAAVIAPGQRSADTTIAAGVGHRIEWWITNTTFIACAATPVPVACSRTNHVCNY